MRRALRGWDMPRFWWRRQRNQHLESIRLLHTIPNIRWASNLPSKIQYILLTHGHGDHISDAVPVAKRHGSTVVAIYELAAYVAGKGVTETIGMNLGGTVATGRCGGNDGGGQALLGCAG